jgi:hypothetical protein
MSVPCDPPISSSFPLDLVHDIVTYLDMDKREDRNACRRMSLVHSMWTPIAQRRLFATFYADFPYCIPRLIFLTRSTHLAKLVTFIDFSTDVLPPSQLIWLGVAFPRVTSLRPGRLHDHHLSRINDVLCAFRAVMHLDLHWDTKIHPTHVGVGTPYFSQLRTLTMDGPPLVLNLILEAISHSASSRTLTTLCLYYTNGHEIARYSEVNQSIQHLKQLEHLVLQVFDEDTIIDGAALVNSSSEFN